MAWIDDIDVLNNAATQGDWNGVNGGGSSGYDAPTLNDSTATTPIYLEGSACMWWPLKKDQTDGYTYTDVITGTPTLTNRVCVGFLNYPFADIDAIPITALSMRLSSATTFTTNYIQWDARAQILSPENVPISGHTPIIGYEDEGTETGTFNGNAESVGWVGTTGSNNDGKQGGFDWFFLISWVGAHSATLNGTFFSGLYSEYYDNEGNGLPGETSRPIGVLSRAGDVYTSNIRFQLGDGTSDTANIDVTEVGKTVYFNNLHVNHELGFIFVNPAAAYSLHLTLTDCTFLWVDQASTSEIFDGIVWVNNFKIDGCTFVNGGKISLPGDAANRWVRGSKFKSCQAGTASDGEFTDCILDTCTAMTVSGDADFTGTQVLTPNVAANASGFLWNGNFDPDGNLDGMTFTKHGTVDHHAIEFGTASPLTMTLRDMSFSGFSASNNVNSSTLHIKRTTGTVTINLINVTGNVSYRSDGATVNIQQTVSLTITVLDESNSPIQNAQTSIQLADSPFTQLMNEDTNASGIATEAYNYGGDVDVVVKVRKSEDTDNPRYKAASTVQKITSAGLTLTITLEVQPLPI